MAHLPAWADEVDEPFRSDVLFWRSVCASADALLAVLVAVVAAVILELGGAGAWTFVPFVLPAVLLLRAGRAGHASAQQSRAAYPSDVQGWRLAERAAVARVFGHVLLRNRLRHL